MANILTALETEAYIKPKCLLRFKNTKNLSEIRQKKIDSKMNILAYISESKLKSKNSEFLKTHFTSCINCEYFVNTENENIIIIPILIAKLKFKKGCHQIFASIIRLRNSKN